MTDTTTDQGTPATSAPVDNSAIQNAPIAQTGTTQAALENIAQNNPVPDAPVSSSAATPGYNDPNPTTEEVQSQNSQLTARISNLELVLQRFFADYYRTEGYVNDDGSFNLGE